MAVKLLLKAVQKASFRIAGAAASVHAGRDTAGDAASAAARRGNLSHATILFCYFISKHAKREGICRTCAFRCRNSVLRYFAPENRRGKQACSIRDTFLPQNRHFPPRGTGVGRKIQLHPKGSCAIIELTYKRTALPPDMRVRKCGSSVRGGAACRVRFSWQRLARRVSVS